MCGIFCLLNVNTDEQQEGSKMCKANIEASFMKGKNRGPERSSISFTDNMIMGFHRLAINGYKNEDSGQPIVKDNCTLICNGEIYNWEYLSKISDTVCSSGSDCEIIINLYRKYGIEKTLQLIDGVFAFVLIDRLDNNVFIARDALGVRPLFIWSNNVILDNILVASEIKMGHELLNNHISPKPFLPGNYMRINLSNQRDRVTKSFYNLESFTNYSISTLEQTDVLIRNTLISAVNKRINNTDREIACLLSGGLDSSLICSIVAKLYKERHGPESISKMHTWSIGMEGSEDLKYAKKVATFLGTTHHEIVCSEKEFLDAIPEVIYSIESRDITTVRASVGNYLICKYIKENSEAKVIFNGDGSDELTGGYLYFHYAPDSIEFDIECRRLLKDLHFFDILRSDRCISCHGLEARTPFLDRVFVQSYLSIPAHLRFHALNNKCEKFLLRHAFSEGGYLPKEVLWRRKEAFSDGVSKATKSWFEVIQDHTKNIMDMASGADAEKAYYSKIFEKHYGSEEHTKHVMPYKWMPKFITTTDASARTLPIYNNIKV